MIAFNKGEEPEGVPHMTEEMAKKLITSMLFQQAPPPPPLFKKSTPIQTTHIAEYIDDMMFIQDYKILNITVQKGLDNNLTFTINHKAK